jgi:hypothetical protein
MGRFRHKLSRTLSQLPWLVAVIGNTLACSPAKAPGPQRARAPGLPPEPQASLSSMPTVQPLRALEEGSESPSNSAKRPEDTEPDSEPWEKRLKYPDNPPECIDLGRSKCHWLCVRYATTLLPFAAKRGIDCLRKAAEKEKDDSYACLDPCTRATCTATAFAEIKGRADWRCQTTVRKKAKESSDSSYAAVVAEECGTYTRGMNRVGRDRFIECILSTMSSFRFCLWDATVAPCGHEKEGHSDIDELE